jgi:crotonobetainyl-CoA:carnitine CoA-transferase CaiB-like acyl-CoA transferase
VKSEGFVLPLQGIRVVEFCEVASGPFCGMMLADFGAEVIKIEKPGTGDTLRAWPPINAGFSENFASLNRNKKSITLDLKDAGERALARDLALAADVVIENYRPGVMARNGLDYRALSKIKPSLVYCSISAFGQTGPRAGEGGFDLTIQAAAGVMSVTGAPGEAPVKCGVPIADFAAGAYGAFAVSAALRKAAQTGQGEHIDVSMLGVTLGFAALQTSEYFGTGKDPQKLGSAHPRNAPYQAFRAKDGYFVMAAGNDRLWSSVCRVVERPEWVEDARFVSTAERTKNQVELCALLEANFASHDAAHWVETFTAANVPCGPINTYSQILNDPQVAHMGWVRDMVLPNGAETKTFICPVMLSGKNVEVRSPPPKLGQHRDEIISWLRDATASGQVGAAK